MIYWISTGLASLLLTTSALSYLFHQATIDGVRDLGFPDFFRIQLAVLKLVAACVLLAPFVPVQIKEWAYAGAALFCLTAIVAHYAHGDPFALHMINLAALAVLLTSNMYLPR